MKDKIKLMPIVGTRPDAIKMAPLILALRRRAGFDTVVCASGQHREMLAQSLGVFGITPEYNLDVMREGQTPATVTSAVLEAIGAVYEAERPDMVLVHGDTTTAVAAALAAFYQKIPVGHVEAGLRSGDIYSPFPEEMNRLLLDRLATLLFAPTKHCAACLAQEGIHGNVSITGNTECDAVLYTTSQPYDLRKIPGLEDFDPARRTVFITAHRRENLGGPLEQICAAIKELARRFPDVQFVYPVHMNPAVRNTVFPALGNIANIRLTDTVDPVAAHHLIAHSELVLTDSGGIQEDAPALHKPVLVLRRETERPEGIEAGVAALAGVERDAIVAMASLLLSDPAARRKMASAPNPYGDGHAAERICDELEKHFN